MQAVTECQSAALTTSYTPICEPKAPGRIRTCDPTIIMVCSRPLSYGGLEFNEKERVGELYEMALKKSTHGNKKLPPL
jgi:hypothetical protein